MNTLLIIFSVVSLVIAGNVVLAVVRRIRGNAATAKNDESHASADDHSRFIKQYDDDMTRNRLGYGPNSSFNMYDDH